MGKIAWYYHTATQTFPALRDGNYGHPPAQLLINTINYYHLYICLPGTTQVHTLLLHRHLTYSLKPPIRHYRALQLLLSPPISLGQINTHLHVHVSPKDRALLSHHKTLQGTSTPSYHPYLLPITPQDITGHIHSHVSPVTPTPSIRYYRAHLLLPITIRYYRAYLLSPITVHTLQGTCTPKHTARVLHHLFTLPVLPT